LQKCFIFPLALVFHHAYICNCIYMGTHVHVCVCVCLGLLCIWLPFHFFVFARQQVRTRAFKHMHVASALSIHTHTLAQSYMYAFTHTPKALEPIYMKRFCCSPIVWTCCLFCHSFHSCHFFFCTHYSAA